MSALSERPDGAVVGTREPHESADLHVTGRALYTDDIAMARKDALTAWPVQAPHAHAAVTAIRTEAALAVSGVAYVLTASDVPGVNDSGVSGDEPLFPEKCGTTAKRCAGFWGRRPSRRGSAPPPSRSTTIRCRPS